MEEFRNLREYREHLVQKLAQVDELMANLRSVVPLDLDDIDTPPKRRKARLEAPSPGKQPSRKRLENAKSREATLLDLLKDRKEGIKVAEVIPAMEKAGYKFSGAKKVNWLYTPRAKKLGLLVKDAVVRAK